jgi:hypothetical protein
LIYFQSAVGGGSSRFELLSILSNSLEQGNYRELKRISPSEGQISAHWSSKINPLAGEFPKGIGTGN